MTLSYHVTALILNLWENAIQFEFFGMNQELSPSVQDMWHFYLGNSLKGKNPHKKKTKLETQFQNLFVMKKLGIC